MTCKLRPVPDTLEYEASAGDTVAVVVDRPEILLIQRARYAEKDIAIPSPPAKSISFNVAQGRQTLEVVCVFSAGTAGNGRLLEDCGGGNSQPVRDVPGTEPLQVIIITGKQNA